MPKPLNLGQHMASCLVQPIFQRENRKATIGLRQVMGYKLPVWQRDFVWSNDQCVKLIESLWLGINIGTYTFNRSRNNEDYDDLLIDGQQRMTAIQKYLDGDFPVFGYYWQDLDKVEQRKLTFSHFHCYITESDDENYLRSYYDLVNFSGTAHKEDERATI